MSEFAPPWRKPKMTKAQVKKYIKELEEKRKIAQKKLEQAKKDWVFEKEKKELQEIEELIDDL